MLQQCLFDQIRGLIYINQLESQQNPKLFADEIYLETSECYLIMSTILSADVGGTKTHIQLAYYADGKLEIIKTEKFPSANFTYFSDLLQKFLPENYSIDCACFAVAGPVTHNAEFSESQVTNLPWIIHSRDLEKQFQINKVLLLNDFEAIGYALDYLAADDFLTLQKGQAKPLGVKAIIGAGTGLGQAILVHNGKHYSVIPTEGGHADFAATDATEIALFEFLNKQYAHVSYERVLSGQGMVNIFQFLVETYKTQHTPEVQNILNTADPSAAVAIAGAEKSHAVACETVSLFMKIYGAQAGNLALTCLAQDGLYIAGGIAAKNLYAFDDGEFIRAFNAKGRMQKITERIPVHVIKNQHAGIIGATHFARRMI